MISDARIVLHHLEIPLRADFHTAQSRVGARDVGLVESTRGGVTGWGEASPYPGQDETMAAVVESARSGVLAPTLRAGVSEAEADRSARSRGVSLADEVGATVDSVAASVAIGLGGDPLSDVRAGVARGVSRFKIKIGPGHVDHVALIRSANASCVIGVDANGSFDRRSVEEFAGLADLGIAYIEQPCDINDESSLARVKQLVDAPIFADESVRSITDGESVLGSALIDGVVVKPGRLGFEGARELIALAERLGKRWRASGLLETGIGRAYTDIFAAIPSAFVSDVAPGDWFLERDVAPTRFTDGAVVTPTGPGLGVVPSPEVIDRYLVATYEVSVT